MTAFNSVKELYQAYSLYHKRGVMPRAVYENQIENAVPISPLKEFTYIEDMSSEEIERNFEDIENTGVIVTGFGITPEDLVYVKENSECKISNFKTSICRIGYTEQGVYYKVFERRQRVTLTENGEPADIFVSRENEKYITGQACVRIRKLDNPRKTKRERERKRQENEEIKKLSRGFWKFAAIAMQFAIPFIYAENFTADVVIGWLFWLLALLNLVTMNRLLIGGLMLPWTAAHSLCKIRGFGGFLLRLIAIPLTVLLSSVMVHLPSFIAMWIVFEYLESDSAMGIIVVSLAISAITGAIIKKLINKD